MATYKAIHISMAPGSLFTDLMGMFGPLVQSIAAGAPYSITEGVFQDRPTIEVCLNTDADTLVYHVYVLWPVLVGVAYPIRYFTESPGFSRVDQYFWTSALDIDTAVIDEAFEALLENGMCIYLGTVTGESTSTPTYQEAEVIAGKLVVKTASWEVGGVLDAALVSQRITVHNQGFWAASEELQEQFVSFSDSELPTSPQPFLGSGQLDRIADALDAISMSDVDVSINHGAAMWSIRGKVRIG